MFWWGVLPVAQRKKLLDKYSSKKKALESSGKSKSSRRSKSKESRKKKRIDFSHIEEAGKVSDIFGHVWATRFATLEANRLCLEF